MSNPPPDVVEQARWETWLHHLGYLLHRDHGWGRDTGAVFAEQHKADLRKYYDAGKSPKDAILADLRAVRH